MPINLPGILTTMLLFYQFVTSFCLLMAGTNGFNEYEQLLRHDLLAQYDKLSLPGASTAVEFRLTIKHFEMIEESHSLLVDAWMVNEWKDPRLSWNARSYGGIRKIMIPHNLVWKPDIDVYNSATPEKDMTYGDTLVIVYNVGKVLFVPPIKLQFTCVMDLTNWPHDKHNCTIILGSWVHDGYTIDLQVKDEKPEIDMPVRTTESGQNLTRGYWNLLDSKITRDYRFYNCCVEPYITIHMSMYVERNAPAYAWIVKGPALGMSLLTLVLFMLPPAAGEKMTFGVLCLLLHVVFIAYSSYIINITPSHLPLIIEMICKQAMLVIASLVFGALSLRLARDPHTSGLSSFVKAPLVFLSSFLCLQNYKNLVGFTVWEVSRVHHQTYSRSLKSDEFELRENGNGHVYSGEISVSPGLDWLLLAAVIDRICLIVFIVISIINFVFYKSVLL
ncbi:acetylcholine receptor subunit alpha-type acr-16-like isoform X1 [Macrobrachium rosenbergii]|uniref:acetylcholine receptor subunit alpha-type acr-16-like isoform X1 n=2 Tax=Macrobrachium rosenbergii TaxID=79674 RepID=UPI0034D427D1